MEKSNNNIERRRFFRIDDDVNLFYKSVDERSIIAASKVSDDMLSSCSLITALDVLDQESRIIMFRLEKNDPEIAEYLKLQDAKIKLIAETLMRQGNDFNEGTMRSANISASGLAFDSIEAISENSFLQIKLLLTSCFAVISIYGKVIHCQKSDVIDGKQHYQIGLDYINLKDQDREILIKHVVKRQMQQIRENKEL